MEIFQNILIETQQTAMGEPKKDVYLSHKAK